AYAVELSAEDGIRLVLAFPTLPESGTYSVIEYDPRARTGAYARLEIPSDDETVSALYLNNPAGTVRIHNSGTALSGLFDITVSLIAPARDVDGKRLPETMTISGVFQNMPFE
ncbi:MAG: hypothetical protein ACPG7F_22575, partial [Aggregatilineales bacterium]